MAVVAASNAEAQMSTTQAKNCRGLNRSFRQALTLFSFLAVILLSVPTFAQSLTDWRLAKSRNELDGTVSISAFTFSINELIARSIEKRIAFGFTCDFTRIAIAAPDLGFAVDKYAVDEYGDDTRIQNVRMKLDEGPVRYFKFVVGEENHDLMTLSEDTVGELIEELGKGNRVLIEVELYNTKGKEQVARFSLSGIEKIFEECQDQAGTLIPSAAITETERLERVIRTNILPCLVMPDFIADKRVPRVTITIDFNRDGSVRGARVIDQPILWGNPNYLASVEAVRRATLDRRCREMELPVARYDLWNEVDVDFNLAEMLDK